VQFLQSYFTHREALLQQDVSAYLRYLAVQQDSAAHTVAGASAPNASPTPHSSKIIVRDLPGLVSRAATHTLQPRL